MSYDHASDAHPSDSEAETNTCRERAAPALSRQVKDESDAQDEDSQKVLLSETTGDILNGIIPRPRIVKLKLPLDATFLA